MSIRRAAALRSDDVCEIVCIRPGGAEGTQAVYVRRPIYDPPFYSEVEYARADFSPLQLLSLIRFSEGVRVITQTVAI